MSLNPTMDTQLGLENYIEIITDTTDELNRETKILKLRSGRTVAYD